MLAVGRSASAALYGMAAVGVMLAGCTVPGVPRTEIVGRESVTVGGRTCQFITRRTETATVNGMHRYTDSVMRCNGQDYTCDDMSAEHCARAIASGPGRRSNGTSG